MDKSLLDAGTPEPQEIPGGHSKQQLLSVNHQPTIVRELPSGTSQPLSMHHHLLLVPSTAISDPQLRSANCWPAFDM